MSRSARRSSSSRGGLLLALALLPAAVVACGSESAGESAHSPDRTTGAPVVIILKDIAFTPADVIVPAGGSVEWRWEDGVIPHNVVAEDFASETQSSGTFTHRFDTAGSFPYVCKIHPTMTGTVTVTV